MPTNSSLAQYYTMDYKGVPRYLMTKDGQSYNANEAQIADWQTKGWQLTPSTPANKSYTGDGWTLSDNQSSSGSTTQLVYRMGADGQIQKEAITPDVLQLNLDVGWVTSEAEAKQQTVQPEWTPGVTLSPEAAQKLDADFQAFSNVSDTLNTTTPSATTATTTPTSASLLPDNILNSPDYQSLGTDLQGVLELMYGAMSANTAQNQQLAFDAISVAQEYVDPYIGVMIAFQKDELMDKFAYEQRSLSARQASYSANLSAIGTLKQNATLEEKQVLNAIGREYEMKKTQTQNEMADRGLTYSSTRSDLESYIGYQNRDLIQSTRRNTQNTLANLDARAGEAMASLSAAQASYDYGRQNAARQAEQQFGTAAYNQMGLGIQSIGGNNGVPEYAGQIQMDRQNMILDLATRIQDYGTPAALGSLFNSNTTA